MTLDPYFLRVRPAYGPGDVSDIRGNHPLPVALPVEPFGAALVAERTPVVQLNFHYNINPDIITTNVVNGSVTTADSMAVLSTSAAASSSAELLSKAIVRYGPGQSITALFTAIFTPGVEGSTQIIGIGNSQDGFFFGYNGTEFGVLRRRDSVDTWTPQSEWNRDNADGDPNTLGELTQIDFAKGNVFKIEYQWLGFGAITFSIEDPSTGRFCPVHEIMYANSSVSTSINNPTIPLCAKVENTTNNSDVVLKTASMGGYLNGPERLLGPRHAISNLKSGVGTTQTNIVTIRNKSTFAGKDNRVYARLLIMSFATDGNKACELRVTLDATLGGTPSYSDISTNSSVMEYDTAGTTVTGGLREFTIFANPVDARDRPLLPYAIDIYPGESLTLSGAASSTTSDIGMSIAWQEAF